MDSFTQRPDLPGEIYDIESLIEAASKLSPTSAERRDIQRSRAARRGESEQDFLRRYKSAYDEDFNQDYDRELGYKVLDNTDPAFQQGEDRPITEQEKFQLQRSGRKEFGSKTHQDKFKVLSRVGPPVFGERGIFGDFDKRTGKKKYDDEFTNYSSETNKAHSNEALKRLESMYPGALQAQSGNPEVDALATRLMVQAYPEIALQREREESQRLRAQSESENVNLIAALRQELQERPVVSSGLSDLPDFVRAQDLGATYEPARFRPQYLDPTEAMAAGPAPSQDSPTNIPVGKIRPWVLERMLYGNDMFGPIVENPNFEGVAIQSQLDRLQSGLQGLVAQSNYKLNPALQRIADTGPRSMAEVQYLLDKTFEINESLPKPKKAVKPNGNGKRVAASAEKGVDEALSLLGIKKAIPNLAQALYMLNEAQRPRVTTTSGGQPVTTEATLRFIRRDNLPKQTTVDIVGNSLPLMRFGRTALQQAPKMRYGVPVAANFRKAAANIGDSSAGATLTGEVVESGQDAFLRRMADSLEGPLGYTIPKTGERYSRPGLKVEPDGSRSGQIITNESKIKEYMEAKRQDEYIDTSIGIRKSHRDIKNERERLAQRRPTYGPIKDFSAFESDPPYAESQRQRDMDSYLAPIIERAAYGTGTPTGMGGYTTTVGTTAGLQAAAPALMRPQMLNPETGKPFNPPSGFGGRARRGIPTIRGGRIPRMGGLGY